MTAKPDDLRASAETVPVMEERLRVDRRVVEEGRVRVSLRTELEDHLVEQDLRSEHIAVERVPIGRELAVGEAPPGPREEEGGAVLVVPVLEEVLVVEKRLVLREELRLRRRTTTEAVREPVTLRRQHADVERLDPAAGPAPGTAAAGTKNA